MDCCEKLLQKCDAAFLLDAAAVTAGSTAGGALCGASGALVGITAATGALYGVTAGVIFCVSYVLATCITDKDDVRLLIASILAVVGATLITSAALGVKVTLAAGLMMSAASVAASFGLYLLVTEIGTTIDEWECCWESESTKLMKKYIHRERVTTSNTETTNNA